MVRTLKLRIFVSVFILVFFFSPAFAKPHAVFQHSLLNSLMAGVYKGDMKVSELLKYGDFGVGTFDRLDGEMIIVDGKIYQVRSDGNVIERHGDAKVPFAQVCSFKPQESFAISNIPSLESVKTLIWSKLNSKNLIYAIKIKGRFNYVKTRSVPKQSEPYRPLAEIIKKQSVFEFSAVEGQVIGFWLPDFIKGINAPGFHFHFLNKELTAGGHVIEMSVASAEVMLDDIYKYNLEFPRESSFLNKDLSGDLQYKP
ncbi:MAG: acetolactate decarboxylase [Candidatus Saganbacteria bacterium]|nr:acetolactate decarboxylase [Candidatus Saganbacteria bacterium]